MGLYDIVMLHSNAYTGHSASSSFVLAGKGVMLYSMNITPIQTHNNAHSVSEGVDDPFSSHFAFKERLWASVPGR